MPEPFTFTSIGQIHSPYREKFGIPRQPGLVDVPARIEIFSEYSRAEAFRGLEQFSHIWVNFVFHQSQREQWKPTVRPPRLGGNERVGVFASRSMFRPNSLGLSVVKLESIESDGKNILLNIRGGDFLHGTPVLDIKPYLPYVDAVPEAKGGYASEAPPRIKVQFTPEANRQLAEQAHQYPQLTSIIKSIIEYDPRPAYKATEESQKQLFSMHLYEFNVSWQMEQGIAVIYDIDQVK